MEASVQHSLSRAHSPHAHDWTSIEREERVVKRCEVVAGRSAALACSRGFDRRPRSRDSDRILFGRKRLRSRPCHAVPCPPGPCQVPKRVEDRRSGNESRPDVCRVNGGAFLGEPTPANRTEPHVVINARDSRAHLIVPMIRSKVDATGTRDGAWRHLRAASGTSRVTRKEDVRRSGSVGRDSSQSCHSSARLPRQVRRTVCGDGSG